MKKIRRKRWFFLAVLMMALSISPTASVFAGGSSGGGSSGGSGSGYVSSQPVYWELPPITKRILLPDNKTKFRGEVKFDIKVTLLTYGPQGPQPLKWMAKRSAFSISFSGNEMGNGNSVEKSGEIDTLVRGMVSTLEQQLPMPGGGGGNGGPGKPYNGILVEISESESNTPGLNRVFPEKILWKLSWI